MKGHSIAAYSDRKHIFHKLRRLQHKEALDKQPKAHRIAVNGTGVGCKSAEGPNWLASYCIEGSHNPIVPSTHLKKSLRKWT